MDFSPEFGLYINFAFGQEAGENADKTPAFMGFVFLNLVMRKRASKKRASANLSDKKRRY